MNTQELKQYIDRVLGNNIRCLLPSYWWKKLFGEVVDNIDTVSKSTKSSIDKLSTRVSKVEKGSSSIVNTTYEELCRKRYNGELVPGQSYKITDYRCIVNDDDYYVSSSNDINQFYIVVTALSEHTLNENAKAISSSDWESSFDALEIKYTLDNDPSKYTWAKKEYHKYDVVASYVYGDKVRWASIYWDDIQKKYIEEDSNGDVYLVNSLTDTTALSKTSFNVGDTIYINRYRTVVETKVLYIDSMKDNGDGVLVNCQSSYEYSTYYRPFIWDDVDGVYKCNTELGYDFLCPNTSYSTPLEKQSRFYKGRYYNIRQRKKNFIELVSIGTFDIATPISPDIETCYLWSWNDDLNKYVLTSESDEYLGTSDTDPTPLPKTEFSEGDTVYMYNNGKYDESFTVSFTKDSVIPEGRIYLGIKELPVLCAPFDWNSELNAYYSEDAYQIPIDFKEGSLINKDYDFSSNVSYGVISTSEGSGSISSSGKTVGFYTSGGRGVIYYMKDLNNNEAYYDFKHIQFRDSNGNLRYTFYNGTNDASEYSHCFGNCIKPSTHIYDKFTLNKVCIGPYSGEVLGGFPSNITVSGDVYNKVFDRPKSNSYIGLNSKGEVIITNIYDDNASDNIELLKQEIIDNEEVTAAALNDLKGKVDNLSSNDETNEIIAKSLNELNEKVETTEVVNVYLDTRHKFYVTDKVLFDNLNTKVIIHGARYIIFDTELFTDIPLNLLVDAAFSIATGGRISIPIVDKHYGNIQIKTYLELVLYDNNSFDAYIHETKTEFGDKLTIHYTKYDATIDQTTDNALIDRVWEIE